MQPKLFARVVRGEINHQKSCSQQTVLLLQWLGKNKWEVSKWACLVMSEWDDCCSSVVVSCWYKKLVAETRDSLESQKKGRSAVGSRYQATASEYTASWEDIIVCSSLLQSVWIRETVIITCKSRICKGSINPNAAYSHECAMLG
jgi:hypothetical protein